MQVCIIYLGFILWNYIAEKPSSEEDNTSIRRFFHLEAATDGDDLDRHCGLSLPVRGVQYLILVQSPKTIFVLKIAKLENIFDDGYDKTWTN